MSSRVGRKPIEIPSGVEIRLDGDVAVLKGSKGEIKQKIHPLVKVEIKDNVVSLSASADKNSPKFANAISGTMRALLSNHVTGVSQGFTKKLLLVGVGYKVKVINKDGKDAVDLSLGFSHPVVYTAPEGVTLKAVSATELDVSGFDKQQVGQVAADIRSIRPPEVYKGKGVRYASESIILKETKKK